MSLNVLLDIWIFEGTVIVILSTISSYCTFWLQYEISTSLEGVSLSVTCGMSLRNTSASSFTYYTLMVIRLLKLVGILLQLKSFPSLQSIANSLSETQSHTDSNLPWNSYALLWEEKKYPSSLFSQFKILFNLWPFWLDSDLLLSHGAAWQCVLLFRVKA